MGISNRKLLEQMDGHRVVIRRQEDRIRELEARLARAIRTIETLRRINTSLRENNGTPAWRGDTLAP